MKKSHSAAEPQLTVAQERRISRASGNRLHIGGREGRLFFQGGELSGQAGGAEIDQALDTPFKVVAAAKAA